MGQWACTPYGLIWYWLTDNLRFASVLSMRLPEFGDIQWLYALWKVDNAHPEIALSGWALDDICIKLDVSVGGVDFL